MLVYITKWHIIYDIINRPDKYPKPNPYLVSTSKGIKIYPLDLMGTCMIVGVFTLSAPYPTCCQPHSLMGRARHLVRTERLGSVPRFIKKFDSKKNRNQFPKVEPRNFGSVPVLSERTKI